MDRLCGPGHCPVHCIPFTWKDAVAEPVATGPLQDTPLKYLPNEPKSVENDQDLTELLISHIINFMLTNFLTL
jgi:hypothetical protein